MMQLYKPYLIASGVFMLALLMLLLREGASFNLAHLIAPTLFFVAGVVLSKLLKQQFANI